MSEEVFDLPEDIKASIEDHVGSGSGLADGEEIEADQPQEDVQA